MNDLFVFHALGSPLKGFSKLLSFFIDHNLANTIDLDNIIALWHTGDPFTFLELFLHPGYGSLLAQLVVKLGKQELNVLVQHPTGIGGIGGLGNGKDRHAIFFPQVLR
nr:hypothetical protein [Flavisolibacter nicotianae]